MHLSMAKSKNYTGNASRNNVPNKRLLSGTFFCAVLGNGFAYTLITEK